MGESVRNLRPVLVAFIAVASRPSYARAQVDDCAEDLVHPPEAVVHGKTAGEWSARFYQWLLAIPSPLNPALDPTGARCGIEQTAPVFFLAEGILGVTEPVVFKDCYVPCGRDILIPLWSSVFWAPGDCDAGRLDDCRAIVKQVIGR